jgi:hypothetical protein
MAAPTPVYLEVGNKKVFACAVDWPGWARAARSEDGALETLAAYEARYRLVTDEAGVRFPRSVASSFEVVERLEGNATTDFGAPDKVADVDRAPASAAQARRMAALLEASWSVFDDVVATAPAALRKGPRGGGRDRDKIVEHVIESVISYSRALGLRGRRPSWDDADAVAAFRSELLDRVRRPSDGTAASEKGWPPRYAVRRMAWHVLDHAWEIEDKSDETLTSSPAPAPPA